MELEIYWTQFPEDDFIKILIIQSTIYNLQFYSLQPTAYSLSPNPLKLILEIKSSRINKQFLKVSNDKSENEQAFYPILGSTNI